MNEYINVDRIRNRLKMSHGKVEKNLLGTFQFSYILRKLYIMLDLTPFYYLTWFEVDI